MKIISVLGTHHGLSGNTAGLLKLVLKGAVDQGAENETIVLKGDSVLPCMGCDHCHRKGGCVQKDAFESIKQKISAADGLILASPNYIFRVPLPEGRKSDPAPVAPSRAYDRTWPTG